MKKILTTLLAVAAIGWFVASPFYTAHQMEAALQNNDGEALAKHIDFPDKTTY
jgi:hypothetical protein